VQVKFIWLILWPDRDGEVCAYQRKWRNSLNEEALFNAVDLRGSISHVLWSQGEVVARRNLV